MGTAGPQGPGRSRASRPDPPAGAGTTGEWLDLLRKIAALGVLLGFLIAGCGGPVTPPVQISPATIARQAPGPIPISPRIAKIYGEKYLSELRADTSAVFAISPNGNRFEYRFCKHPDCLMSDDEIATRAIARCNIGVPQKDPANRCVIFDRNGKTQQPYRTWSEADFDMPIPAPPVLAVKDPADLAPGRFSVMTPEGQMVISLRPPLTGATSGRAYFWDTGDGFHQGTWSLKEDRVCVDSIDGRSAVTCGKLYGTDAAHIAGAGLDLFPGKYLPITKLSHTAE